MSFLTIFLNLSILAMIFWSFSLTSSIIKSGKKFSINSASCCSKILILLCLRIAGLSRSVNDLQRKLKPFDSLCKGHDAALEEINILLTKKLFSLPITDDQEADLVEIVNQFEYLVEQLSQFEKTIFEISEKSSSKDNIVQECAIICDQIDSIKKSVEILKSLFKTIGVKFKDKID